ncbi:MAG: adenine deaminase [Bernardetiaceae bacterium]|nr:adenine deaminase [Bernardetiaceae bacterium]
MVIRTNVVNIAEKRIIPSAIFIEQGKIVRIETADVEDCKDYALPGFIDAHVHVESSMLVPLEFAKLAVRHGTVATVSDPHEIANVLGKSGVDYMLSNAEQVPFHFFFGAPSCVPATPFETSGAILPLEDIEALLDDDRIRYLSEMMNYPAVLKREAEVMSKIKAALSRRKTVDGHAPGLQGEKVQKYADAGIYTDHECFTEEEAVSKLAAGMKILIREGSAAKNFKALIPLIKHYENEIMFCSDDKHPDDLLLGHINKLVARGVAAGYDLYKLLKAACLNPIRHYGLSVGQLREGDDADFIIVEDLRDFDVTTTYIRGEAVFANAQVHMPSIDIAIKNKFELRPKKLEDFSLKAKTENIQVIKALEGELITESFTTTAKISEGGEAISDISRDLLKIAVINRYDSDAVPALAFIHGFGLKKGAIASTVAHDSHNIIAIGTNDEDLTRAVNLLIEAKGGVAAVSETEEKILPLPIAGLMSDQSGEWVAARYCEIDKFAKTALGASLHAPFMTLSFMALLVIPSLKLSDKGLFDGSKFEFTEVFV